MNAVDIIVKKRDGGELNREELRFFINGFTQDRIPDYQAAAWAMAVFFQGMTPAETAELTLAMAESGEMLDQHQDLPAETVIVDKHSSGGVGDKVSLVVGPIVAACGLPVGKLSGRGLGFSGGTIDKLESIPGWSPDVDADHFRRQLREVGLVIAGQTKELAPADKQLYALRDVTGTVPSLPLIAASIMSKKLASGSDAILLDVKCGRGAFMQTLAEATALAQRMVEIGSHAGRRMTALITQMEQPLGQAVGNALEVKEAIATLKGDGPADFWALVENVAGEMLVLGKKAQRLEEAKKMAAETVASGTALAKFREFVVAQGGDGAYVDDPARFPVAPVQRTVRADRAGWVHAFDAQEVGLAAVDLGGGRHAKTDTIDPAVGVICHAKVGDRVEVAAPLFTVHAATDAAAQVAAQRIRAAIRLEDGPCDVLPVIYDRIVG